MESIRALEERMTEMERTLFDIQSNINRLVQGIFGDEKLNFPGLLKSYDSLQGQIDELERKSREQVDNIRKNEIADLKKEIEDLKRVNVKQDIAIDAKKGLTDEVVKWTTRGFWIVIFIIALMLLLTGKIGIVDVFNLK